MNSFYDIKKGDIVTVFDEYKHDLDYHKIEVDSIEYDKEYITETNPRGKVCFGKDLTCWDEKIRDYDTDDYITVVTESNYIK